MPISLKDKRIELGLTLEDVGKAVGVGKSTVRKWETGSIGNMGRDKIAALAKVLHISPMDIIDPDNAISDTIADKIHDVSVKLNPDRHQNVYNYANHQLSEQNNNVVQLSDYTDNVEHTETVYGAVSAGTGQYLDHEQPEQVVVRGSAPEHDFAVKVVGNSMEPTFNDGQIVYVNKLVNESDIRNNQFVIAEVNGEAYIKKLSFNDDYVRLISLNPSYDDIIIHDYDDFLIRGIVVI